MKAFTVKVVFRANGDFVVSGVLNDGTKVEKEYGDGWSVPAAKGDFFRWIGEIELIK